MAIYLDAQSYNFHIRLYSIIRSESVMHCGGEIVCYFHQMEGVQYLQAKLFPTCTIAAKGILRVNYLKQNINTNFIPFPMLICFHQHYI